jgi:hypothetical protein
MCIRTECHNIIKKKDWFLYEKKLNIESITGFIAVFKKMGQLIKKNINQSYFIMYSRDLNEKFKKN